MGLFCWVCSDLREWASPRALAAHQRSHDRHADRITRDASPRENAELRAGFRDWTRILTWGSKGKGSAYLAGASATKTGHYRLRIVDPDGRGGSVLGPALKDAGKAPWSDTVVRLFPNNAEFHRAAERWAESNARRGQKAA